MALEHGSLCVSALQLQNGNNGIALHSKNVKRAIHQCAQIRSPATNDRRNIIFRTNYLMFLLLGLFVVGGCFFFSLSFPQSTWYGLLLPKSSWACTAAAVLLLEQVIPMPESQEGRSSAWLRLVRDLAFLFLCSVNFRDWTYIHTFSPAWSFNNKASERVAKVTAEWI